MDAIATMPSPADELLKKGIPASYRDDQNRLIREYPDGKKFLVHYDEEKNITYLGEEIND